ncbi:winged helix-turn-helix transcriptional regulator [Methanobacterium sp.]|uniref:winged helix-turn-helix transcriptional regulator n=1 Tax=Methanobacterium sp. TaxID=2164 RepID=UPI003C70A5EA
MNNEMSCGSFCPVSKALTFISKKWSIEIIRDMFFGKKRFKEFKEGKPNLSNKVLSDCLKNLENNGIIEKRILNSTPVSTEYHLTELGKSLNRVIYELAIFALENSDNKECAEESVRIRIKESFRETLQISD